MANTYILSERDRADLQALLRERRGLATVRSARSQPIRYDGSVVWRNDASETCPAWGVIRVTGTDSTAERRLTFYTGDKPSTTFSRLYLINGRFDVEQGDYGQAWPIGVAAYALYDTTHTPAYGEGWGPKPSQWKLYKGYYGFTITGNREYLNSVDIVHAVGHVIDHVKGQTDAAINKAASGNVSVLAGPTKGSETDDGWTLSMHNAYANVAISKTVQGRFIGNGWEFTTAEC